MIHIPKEHCQFITVYIVYHINLSNCIYHFLSQSMEELMILEIYTEVYWVLIEKIIIL